MGEADPELFEALSMQRVALLCLAGSIVRNNTDADAVKQLANDIIDGAGGLEKAGKAVDRALDFFGQPDDWSEYQN